MHGRLQVTRTIRACVCTHMHDMWLLQFIIPTHACVYVTQGAPAVARMASYEALAGTFAVPMTSPPKSIGSLGTDSYDSTVEDAQCPYTRKKDLIHIAPDRAVPPGGVPAANPGHTDKPAANPGHTQVPAAEAGHTQVPAANPDHTHVPAANQGHTQVPAANPGHTQALAANPVHTHVPAANPGHTHVPAANQGHTHVPAANPGHTQVPAANQGHTHVPAANLGHTHVPAAHPGHTHVPAAHLGHSSMPPPVNPGSAPHHHVTPQKSRTRQSESGSPPESVTPPSSSTTPAPVPEDKDEEVQKPKLLAEFRLQLLIYAQYPKP